GQTGRQCFLVASSPGIFRIAVLHRVGRPWADFRGSSDLKVTLLVRCMVGRHSRHDHQRISGDGAWSEAARSPSPSHTANVGFGFLFDTRRAGPRWGRSALGSVAASIEPGLLLHFAARVVAFHGAPISRQESGHVLGVLSSLLFMAALLATSAAAQSTVEGVVVDGDGKAIAGTTVVIQRADGGSRLKTKSDAAGRFQFPAVEAGSQALNAEATDYYPSRYEFVLRPRQPLSITIEL